MSFRTGRCAERQMDSCIGIGFVPCTPSHQSSLFQHSHTKPSIVDRASRRGNKQNGSHLWRTRSTVAVCPLRLVGPARTRS